MTRSELQAALAALKRHVKVSYMGGLHDTCCTYIPLIDALEAAEIKGCVDIENAESRSTLRAALCLVIPLEEEPDAD